MAAERQDDWPDVERELTCSICTDILYQPLTLLDCLHTFCGSCLKVWFASQAATAAQGRSHVVGNTPYTCPQCREGVRDTKADWRLTTQLERYLKAHPDCGQTEAEKEEMRRLYKPGDNVIPPVAIPAEQDDADDERLLAEIRELSMRDLESDAARRRGGRSGRHASRSRDSPHSRTNETRQEPLLPAGGPHRSHNTSIAHRVEHQSSLRSLLSASPENVGDVQQEILQSIYAEGVLNDIDLDNLTPEQEEELIERIAEAYRRRQRRRDRSRNHERHQSSTQTSPSSHSSLVAPAAVPSERRAETASNQHHDTTRSRPPISRPHLLEQSHTSTNSGHRRTRSASREAGPSGTAIESIAPINSASRSATDLSERPRTAEAERERRRRVSSGARSRTEPHSVLLRETRRSRASSNNTSTDARSDHAPTLSIASVITRSPASRPATGTQAHPTQQGLSSADNEIRQVPSQSAFAPEPIGNLQEIQAVRMPSIQCHRCQRQNIQQELHYNCSQCRNGEYNMCLSCYREGQGCDHWFGFGYTAHERYRRLEPPEGWPSKYDPPHLLSPRKYGQPDQGPTQTSSSELVLNEGAFCEICLSFCDDHYWSCAYCMEGAWGFCKVCVQRGKHCTHPLLPIARIPTQSQTSDETPNQPRDDKTGTTSSLRMPHLHGAYKAVADATDCDICHRSIAPTNTRYHCYKCNDGNYDICTECYYALIATGNIRQSNGPNGWRRCLKGHRMVIVGYQDVPGRGQQRVTVRDPAGGWRYKDSDEGRGPTSNGPLSPTLPPPADGTLGLRCYAVWNRFPAGEVTDELSFPKNAEIREVETKNSDWCLGVYAGRVGLFPSNHVRML